MKFLLLVSLALAAYGMSPLYYIRSYPNILILTNNQFY